MSYQWYFEGLPIPGGIKSRLPVDQAQTDDLGSYYCVVTNGIGSVTSRVATLSLLAPVDASVDPGLNIVREGLLTVRWQTEEGELETAVTPFGPWSTVSTTGSTFALTAPDPAGFFHVADLYDRPVQVFLPSTYDRQTPLPLVILIHGYTADAEWIENFVGLEPLAEARGFLYCKPEGTRQVPNGARFWNATDACCNFLGARVDDVAYLSHLIQEIVQTYGADPNRIHLMGHSNGGFMSYRMACERADMIASIASIAGATWADVNICPPSQPVSILHVHGTADSSIQYDGGFLNDVPYPGASGSIAVWAGYNDCDGLVADSTLSMDLDLAVEGLDTRVTRYATFPPGGAVELWAIEGAGHVPTFRSGSEASEFSVRAVDWLLAHPKP